MRSEAQNWSGGRVWVLAAQSTPPERTGRPVIARYVHPQRPETAILAKSEGIIGENGSSMVESRSPDVPSHLAARPDPKKPDPATQQLSRWRCTLWPVAAEKFWNALRI